jgi:hypothetical protein
MMNKDKVSKLQHIAFGISANSNRLRTLQGLIKRMTTCIPFLFAFLVGLAIFIPAEAGLNSWTKISDQAQWRDISCTNDGKICYATEYGGYLYKSLDYGATWKKYVHV